MRRSILALAVLAASASPAPAQDADPLRNLREADLFSRQQAAEQRARALENQLFSLETRFDTDRRLRELEQQQARHPPPSMILIPRTAPRSEPARTATAPAGFASIPDDRLAASNARVLEASRNRR